MDLSLSIIQVNNNNTTNFFFLKNIIIVEAFKAWTTNDPPLDLDLYLFNWTNADEVRSGVKPIFQEVGPYRLETFKNKNSLNKPNFIQS